MNKFQSTIRQQNSDRPPVWFMRQAGRYHAHYQALREKHSFIDLCKMPDVSVEAAMGPIRDFDFDAAILFSDLLFPLEVMGMGLSYEPAPKLSWHLRTLADLGRLNGGSGLAEGLRFQAHAMRKLRKALAPEKGLLGFVGGPLTLFCYAVEGGHAGELKSAREGLIDGRFKGFNEKLMGLLAENMALQADAGADTVAILDTCAGEFSPKVYKEQVVPVLRELIAEFQKLSPGVPVTYYSKKTTPDHWRALAELPIACLGVDWNHDLAEVLSEWSGRFAIQGNIDPQWLFLPPKEFERRLLDVFQRVKALPKSARQGWVAGLGHGVLPRTPEENVRLFVKLQREVFGS